MKTMPSYGIKTEEGEEEEEEMPEDIAALDPAVQQRRIIMRSLWMMLLGTFIVLFVSDPFVDVLNVWGKRLDIPGFYVSFVVAPFASNASELLSAYQYARKKTKKAITTSLSTLVGAACMNNTFVLAIFFGLIYFKGLAWEFTAETISIMLVQWLIGAFAILKDSHNVMMGCIILSCYPLCLALVAGLEAMGLD
jgi:Ca2+/H+ antiporter